MDDLFDLDLYFAPQPVQKRGSAEQSTAALIASSMSSEYTYDWSHRQHQAHMVQAPSLAQLGPNSYAPTPNHVAKDSLSARSGDVNGSFGLPAELSLPPLRAPTDNVNFIPQFSELVHFPNVETFSGEADQTKHNGAIAYGNNGSVTYGDNGALGSDVCHDLRRIDGQPGSAFTGIPLLTKKDYVEETRYYTDLDIFKPSEEGPKNSDGSFLNPNVEVNNQYSPGAQSSVEDGTGSKKKLKSPRKTPSKKRKGAVSDNSIVPASQNDSSDSSVVNEYIGFNDVPNYSEGNFSHQSSCSDSNSLAFPPIPMKPESTTLNIGKVKSPRKAPSKKKKVDSSSPVDGSSLKMKLKFEKSIDTASAEWSVSGEVKEAVNSPPATQNSKHSSVHGVHDNLDLIEPASPELTSRVVKNKTEPNPAPERDSSQSEGQKKASDGGKEPAFSPVFPLKSARPPSSSKMPCPTAKAPSYLTGFPMRCPDYPIVYCCNDCARIFTSIRGGQLHECVKKRRGRKAGVKLQ